MKAGKRGEVDVHYITSLPALFGIPKYSLALDKLVEERLVVVSVPSNAGVVESFTTVFIYSFSFPTIRTILGVKLITLYFNLFLLFSLSSL